MLTLELAHKAAHAAIEEAKKQGITISVSVVDASGIPVAGLKMDDALPVSPDFAFTKAYTSATLRLPTAGIAEYAVAGKPYYGTTSLLEGKFTVIAGGFPIEKDGKVIGGIGVGGSHDVNQDVACAQAALAVFK
ncbi:MAG: hypothetical protein QG639_395 [Patescibacteria group bacterium]|jgi:uncharacterized protein GlcG (DUF336 family)|nr:hypothetical protein [Patescibacteria group bacterium]